LHTGASTHRDKTAGSRQSVSAWLLMFALFLGAAIGLATSLTWVLSPTQSLLLALLPLACLAIPIMLTRPVYGFFLLVLLMPVEGIFLRAFEAEIKFYYLAAGALAIICLLASMRRGRITYVRNVLTIPIIFFYLVNAASIVYSPFKVDTLQYLMLFAFLLLIFFLVSFFVTDRKFYEQCVILILLAGMAVSSLGILQLALYRFAGLRLFVVLPSQELMLVNLSRISSLFHEADDLGAFLAYLVLLQVSLLASRHTRHRALLVAGIPLSGLALVLSQTRAALVGLGCGLCVLLFLLWIEGRTVLLRRLVQALGLVLVSVLVLALVSPGVYQSFAYRATRLLATQSINPITGLANPSSTSPRILTIRHMVSQVSSSPSRALLGVGFGTWEQLAMELREEGGPENNVLLSRGGASLPVTAYYDAGVAGLFSVSLIFLVYVGSHLRALSMVRDGPWRAYLNASLCSFVGLFASLLLSNYFFLGVVWLQLGLGAQLVGLAVEQQARGGVRASTAHRSVTFESNKRTTRLQDGRSCARRLRPIVTWATYHGSRLLCAPRKLAPEDSHPPLNETRARVRPATGQPAGDSRQ